MGLSDEASNGDPGLTGLHSNYQKRRDNDDLCLGSEAEMPRAPGAIESPHRLQNSAVSNNYSFIFSPQQAQPPPANRREHATSLGMDDQNSGQYVPSHEHSYNYDLSYPMRHDTMSMGLHQVAYGYHGLYGSIYPPLQNEMWYSEHEFQENWLANSSQGDRPTQKDNIPPSMQPSTSLPSAVPQVNYHPLTLPNQSHNQHTEGNQKPHRLKMFPQKLMSVLLQNPRDDAFVWTQEGNSFIIVDRDIFVTFVLNEAFNKTKFSSFVRKLHRWGFVRLTSGVPPNCFHHPLFTKNCPQNAALIVCVSQQGTGRTAKEETIPLHSASSVPVGTQDSLGTSGEGSERTGDNERGVVMTIHPPGQKLRPDTPDRWL